VASEEEPPAAAAPEPRAVLVVPVVETLDRAGEKVRADVAEDRGVITLEPQAKNT
jgi:hypothetical protein